MLVTVKVGEDEVVFDTTQMGKVFTLYLDEGRDEDWWHTLTSEKGKVFDINITGPEFHENERVTFDYAVYPVDEATLETNHSVWANKADFTEAVAVELRKEGIEP